PVERHDEFYPNLETAEAIKVLCTNQRTVDTRGTNLQRVSPGNRVGDVEKDGDRVANLRAVIMCNRRIVQPLGHDLQRGPAPTGHEHSHETIAGRFERRLDHLRDAVRVNQEPRTSSTD